MLPVLSMLALPSWIASCGSDDPAAGCAKDTDCRSDRICVAGECVDEGEVDKQAECERFAENVCVRASQNGITDPCDKADSGPDQGLIPAEYVDLCVPLIYDCAGVPLNAPCSLGGGL